MNLNPTTVAIWVSLFGLFLLIITAWEWNTENWLLQILHSILNCLGTTLISVGLVSILVELSTIKSVIDEAMKNVLSKNIPLEAYSDEFLNTLKTRITARVSKHSEERLQESVYKLEPYLLNLTNSLYYEYSILKCTVIPDDTKNLFTKKVFIEYEIINDYGLDNRVKLGVALYDMKPNMTENERLQNITIKEFWVNEDNLTNDPLVTQKIIPLNPEDPYEYDYMFVFERPLQKCVSHKVKLVYEYITPQKDCTQSWKLKYPCKKTEHTISIKNNDNWMLRANGFASFYHNTSELGEYYKVDQSVDKCAKIEFNEWAIPGAGYVISFNQK